MPRKIAVVLLLTLAAAADAAAQQTVFVVRHAERADAGAGTGGMMDTDPDLSDAGRARAESLAYMLESANVKTIVATQYKRTQQTAAPLARAVGLPVTTVRANDTNKLPALVREASGNVLIVGHSNTVPATLEALGVTTPVTIDDAEYDSLFIVTMTEPGARMVRLHFR